MLASTLSSLLCSHSLHHSAAAAAKSLQSFPTLCDPMDCSPPGSSIHGILQARVLEWGAIAFSLHQSTPSQVWSRRKTNTVLDLSYEQRDTASARGIWKGIIQTDIQSFQFPPIFATGKFPLCRSSPALGSNLSLLYSKKQMGLL